MVRDVSSWRRIHCPSSNTKGFSTTTPMRIMALLSDRVGDPLHINREKMGISHVFIETRGLEARYDKILVGRGMSRTH